MRRVPWVRRGGRRPLERIRPSLVLLPWVQPFCLGTWEGGWFDFPVVSTVGNFFWWQIIFSWGSLNYTCPISFHQGWCCCLLCPVGLPAWINSNMFVFFWVGYFFFYNDRVGKRGESMSTDDDEIIRKEDVRGRILTPRSPWWWLAPPLLSGPTFTQCIQSLLCFHFYSLTRLSFSFWFTWESGTSSLRTTCLPCPFSFYCSFPSNLSLSLNSSWQL